MMQKPVCRLTRSMNFRLIAYRREIAESNDPIVKLADRIIYHCATVTPRTKDNRGLDSNKTYVLAVRNAAKIIREYVNTETAKAF